MSSRGFYGWRMVYGCMAIGTISWGLGLFGASAFLHAIHQKAGLSIAQISSAITATYLTAALTQIWVGSAINRFGPRVVISLGAVIFAIGVTGLGFVNTIGHAYAAFFALGIGWACLSTTALTTTLSPWFELYQGKAASTAMLGASIGGMVGVPLLMLGFTHLGLAATAVVAALLSLIVITTIAGLVLRHRPSDMGLYPDGIERTQQSTYTPPKHWGRTEALRTKTLRTLMLGFGIGLLVQLGFITHHVALLLPAIGAAGASATVAGTAVAAFVGRIALARYADRVDVRLTACILMLSGAACLATMALFPNAWVLVIVSLIYGLTIGNVTTLSPVIVRREFGAISFGIVYGTAAAGIQLMNSLGPTVYGVLYDYFGTYSAPLLLAAVLKAIAGAIILYGGRFRSSELAAEGARIGPEVRAC